MLDAQRLTCWKAILLSKILEKIRNSKHITKPERDEMTLELEEWMNN